MVANVRVVFFGTPQFAVPSLEHLITSPHQVVGVVTQPDRPRGRGQKVTDAPVKTTALQHGLPIYQPARLRDSEVEDMLRTWAPDLGVVAAYGRIIPESLLSLPRLGMINVHASLLPRYRGAAPVQRAVMDGVPLTGVTIMRMVAALDAGGMFAKVTRPVGPDDTSDVVERDLADLGAALLLDVIADLVAGTAVEEPQDDRLSTYAAKVTKDEGLTDWSLPAIDIHNRIRGLYPWPHAYTYLDNERLILLRSHVGSPGRSELPGTIVDTSGGLLHVATGQSGRLTIDEVQPEGRRAMKTRDYLAGHPIQPGARFTGR
jgi:methionyl-tRNA formyltransferase